MNLKHNNFYTFKTPTCTVIPLLSLFPANPKHLWFFSFSFLHMRLTASMVPMFCLCNTNLYISWLLLSSSFVLLLLLPVSMDGVEYLCAFFKTFKFIWPKIRCWGFRCHVLIKKYNNICCHSCCMKINWKIKLDLFYFFDICCL